MAKQDAYKRAGTTCALVCLLFSLVEVTYSTGGGIGQAMGMSFVPLALIDSLNRVGMDSYFYSYLFSVMVNRVLVPVSLFIIVSRSDKRGTLTRLLPVALPVLWDIIDVARRAGSASLSGGTPDLPTSLMIHAAALVAFALVGFRKKEPGSLPMAVAFGLSFAALMMFLSCLTPFSYYFGGAKGIRNFYIGTLISHVALWFGMANVMLMPASAPAAKSRAWQAKGGSATTFQMGDESYRKLGGYLAVVVYGNYILGVLGIVYALWNIALTQQLASQYASYGIGPAAAILQAACVLCIALAALAIWWATLIKNRSPSFLSFYHYICLGAIILLFFLRLISHESLGFALIEAIFYVIATALYSVYFVKSVRVHTYFGSDEYLRRSPFTRRFAASNSVATNGASVDAGVSSVEGKATVAEHKAAVAKSQAASARVSTKAQGVVQERTCPRCGSVVPEGINFCNKCGKSLNVTKTSTASYQAPVHVVDSRPTARHQRLTSNRQEIESLAYQTAVILRNRRVPTDTVGLLREQGGTGRAVSYRQPINGWKLFMRRSHWERKGGSNDPTSLTRHWDWEWYVLKTNGDLAVYCASYTLAAGMTQVGGVQQRRETLHTLLDLKEFPLRYDTVLDCSADGSLELGRTSPNQDSGKGVYRSVFALDYDGKHETTQADAEAGLLTETYNYPLTVSVGFGSGEGTQVHESGTGIIAALNQLRMSNR